MDRDRHLDLFALCKPTKICVHEASSDRIDLPILKDHVIHAFPGDVEREDRIHASIRTKHRSEFLQIGKSRNTLCSTTVNDYGHFAFFAETPVHVLSADFLLLSLNYKFFCHKLTLN